MSDSRDQVAIWLAKAVFDSLVSDHDDARGDDRMTVFFRTLTVVLGSEEPFDDINELESITLPELRSVMSFLKTSQDSSLQSDRIKFLLNIMQAATEAAINYVNSTDSNKRPRK